MMVVKRAGRFLIFFFHHLSVLGSWPTSKVRRCIETNTSPCSITYVDAVVTPPRRDSHDARAFDSGVAILPCVLVLVTQSNRHMLPYGKKQNRPIYAKASRMRAKSKCGLVPLHLPRAKVSELFLAQTSWVISCYRQAARCTS